VVQYIPHGLAACKRKPSAAGELSLLAPTRPASQRL
jgi:hypothetical protein